VSRHPPCNALGKQLVSYLQYSRYSILDLITMYCALYLYVDAIGYVDDLIQNYSFAHFFKHPTTVETAVFAEAEAMEAMEKIAGISWTEIVTMKICELYGRLYNLVCRVFGFPGSGCKYIHNFPHAEPAV